MPIHRLASIFSGTPRESALYSTAPVNAKREYGETFGNSHHEMSLQRGTRPSDAISELANARRPNPDLPIEADPEYSVGHDRVNEGAVDKSYDAIDRNAVDWTAPMEYKRATGHMAFKRLPVVQHRA